MQRTLSLPRCVTLAALALLHLAALFAWQPGRRVPADIARREGELLFVLPPVPSPYVPPPPAAQPLSARPAPRQPPASRTPGVAPPLPATVAERELPAAPGHVPPSGPAPPGQQDDPVSDVAPETLLARSRKAAVAADRQLRQERRETLALHEPELARKFGAAYIDRSHKITQTVLPNGDVLTKVQTPWSTYCWMKWGNSFMGGRDPFRDSGKQFAVQCPK